MNTQTAYLICKIQKNGVFVLERGFVLSSIFFIVLLLYPIQTSIAQTKQTNPSTAAKIQKDTAKDETFLLVKNIAKENSLNFQKNKLQRKQKKYFNLIDSEIKKAKIILKQGIDYRHFTKELDNLKKIQNYTFDSLLVHNESAQTLRNTTTTSRLLNELINRTDIQIARIENDAEALSLVQINLDTLTRDKDLYIAPQNDSLSQSIYFERLKYMNNDLSKLSKNIKNALDTIQELELNTNLLKYEIQEDIIENESIREKIFNSDIVPKKIISEVAENNKISIGTAIVYSLIKSNILLIFYWSNHSTSILLMLFFVLGIYLYLRSLKSKFMSEGYYDQLKKPAIIFTNPFAISVIITITLFQFFLPQTPYIFTSFLWVLTAIALNLIHKKERNGNSSIIWRSILLLNILCLFDIILLVKTTVEVLFIYFLILATLFFAGYLIYNRKKLHDLNFLKVLYFVSALEILALILMIANHFNFGKMTMSIGIFTLLIWKQFTYTFYFFKEILHFSNFLKESDEEKKIDVLYENNNFLSNTIKKVFFLAWVVLTVSNNDLMKTIIQPYKEAFYAEKQFGDITFSYYNLFLFVSILFLTTLISKMVAFLTSESKNEQQNSEKSNRLGSWILLIRITIITLGLLIAFVSTGIPVDKIVMIISALSVGIGFGLQTLINNLVSGLIIAFEKPVNHDDIIEIGSQIGKMKSIGIRSSVITTWDGADVIIPNGDLLNQHLVNWTLGSSKRRCEIKVGVAYGSDLQEVKKILNNILNEHSLVLKNPPPLIWVTDFNDSSIDLVIKYWIPHFNFTGEVKHELMLKIDENFKKHNIVIPFPQRDIHIQSDTPANKDNLSRKKENQV